MECAKKRGQLDGQLNVVEQPANVFQSIGHALQKMSPALEEAAISIRAEGLHDADVHVRVVVAQEVFAINRDEGGERTKIIVEEMLAEVGRQVGLGVEEKRSDVVL